MFETADRPQTVDDALYEAQEPLLRHALLEAQQRLRQAGRAALLLFAGVEKAGTGDTVNLLNAWMDPRWLDTLAYGPPTADERARPRFWRYWRDLPPHGRIGLRLGAWYTGPVSARVAGRLDAAGFDRALEQIADLEALLADDGLIILKFWMHLGREAQRARLEALSGDPLHAWRVTELDWAQWRAHGDLLAAGERMILRTSTGDAPWHIVEGSDPNYRGLRVGNILLEALEARLSPPTDPPSQAPAPEDAVEADDRADDGAEAHPIPIRPRSILRDVEMGDKPPRSHYERELVRLQGRLNLLQRRAHAAGVSLVAAFEGWDAAGKGGAIRRVTAALDARRYRVIPIAAPTDEEQARHYLWRFWRHLGPAGSVTFFDRSWYGRVLVERVEGFATDAEWRRAYAEINHFERQLCDNGTVLCKFWLHITRDEQAERFEARQKTPYKQWKITPEDWRNRARWDDYEVAVHDMIERTSTAGAPWTIVPGNHKRRARLVVLETLCDRLEAALPPAEPTPRPADGADEPPAADPEV